MEKNLREISVLVVDDEPRARGSIVRILEGETGSIACASSGDEALELLERTPYRIVLLDMLMPGMNGIATLSRIRKLHPGSDVIVMTGMGTDVTEARCGVHGAAAFLRKPFCREELLGVIRSVLEKPRRGGPEAARRRGIRILVADDHDSFREAVARRLHCEGFDVEEARDCAEAVRVFRNGGVDLLVTDFHMPMGDGCVVAQAVRTLRPDVPVAFMTGEASDEEIADTQGFERSVCLSKPFPMEVLVAAAHDLTARRDPEPAGEKSQRALPAFSWWTELLRRAKAVLLEANSGRVRRWLPDYSGLGPTLKAAAR